jgi:hypothetical protein
LFRQNDVIHFNRRLSAELSRSQKVCSGVGAQLAFVPDFSASSFLNSSPSSSAANFHAGEDSLRSAGSASPVEDWLATVQLKLKLFESQAAAVSQASHLMYASLFVRNAQIAQAYAELRANFAAAAESQNTLHELFAGESAFDSRAPVMSLIAAMTD